MKPEIIEFEPSMQPEIVEFRPEHLLAFEWRYTDDPEVDKAWALEIIQRHTFAARSARIGEKIIGCAGLLLLGEDQAYAAVMVSREIETCKLWFHRTVRREFLNLIRENALKYVYCWAPIDDPRCSHAWLRALGFEPTGDTQNDAKGRPHMKYAVGVL